MRTSFQNWEPLWHRIGKSSDGQEWHTRLVAAYSESQRDYHTLQHLEECLQLLDEARTNGLIANPDAVEMALWFHDAVYDSKSSDNEAHSADMAVAALGDNEAAREVARLIMLTKSHKPGEGPDDAWIIDIDLAIFGQSWDRVFEYERQIRQEYIWVPDEVYREKRVEILKGFLDRKHLYLSDWVRHRLEEPARENLRALIRSVKATHPLTLRAPQG